jgi:hypothetical protein
MTRDTFKSAVLDSLRMNRSVVVVMVGYILCALALGYAMGIDVQLRVYSPTISLLMFFNLWAILVAIVLLRLYRHRPASPIKFTWHLLIKDLRVVERGFIALPCVLLFPQFSSAFTSVKSSIPLLHPYGLDPLFARWDSLIHGGHAWELIHPLVGYPLATLVINFSYNLWMFVVWFTFALVTVMTAARVLREQYLLSFFGCWILLGSLAAIGLSSVGPCFYGLLFPADPYGPLMSYLRSVDEIYPIWALSTQDMLWESYTSNTTGLGSGISAMPSLHVAITTLNALLLSRLSRVAGILGWAYLAVILVGSVHLAWHYAIDGYVSILAVLLIWRAAGWWASRSHSPAAVPMPLQGDLEPSFAGRRRADPQSATARSST